MDGEAEEKAVQDEVAEALRRSQPNEVGPHLAPGSMGVSSERVGHAGPGQVGAEGVRETSSSQPEDSGAPEQHAGGEETNPTGLPPKAGYPRADPRHEEEHDGHRQH
jgi:hypothetical protein